MKVTPAGMDHNTEAIDRPCEHGNAYFGCTKIRNFFPYCAINQKVTQLIEAQHYNPEGCGFDFRWVIGIFHGLNPFGPHFGRWVESASNRNEYKERFLRVKAADAKAEFLTTLMCRLPSNLRASYSWKTRGHPGVYRDRFTFTFTLYN